MRLDDRAPRLLGSGAFGFAVALGVVFASAPVAAQTSPGVEAAVRSASRSDRDLKAFYTARDFRPLWITPQGPNRAAAALLDLIEHSDLDGYDPDGFDPDDLREAMERADGGSPKAIGKADIALSRAFVRYASALRRPRDVGTVYLNPELRPQPPAAGALLQSAAATPSLDQYVVSMGWMNPLYGELREELASSRNGGNAAPVPGDATLRIGSFGQDVWLLRRRLGLPADGAYDRSVAAGVSRFQAERAMPVDGVAGPRTIAALNEAPRDRSGLIRANLERARVLPTDPDRRYILVDAAGARLWLYENGRVQDTMKVIVGKPSEPTPMLAGLMHYAIVNPYWNVPPDLARTRVAPEVLKKGVKYLKSMRYELLSDWSAQPAIVDPKTVDWKAVAAGTQEVRVRQLPGRDNSMGKMKFVLPNDMGIYLHDTPDKHLFKQDDRHLSAGCVRVEDAQRLAKWLFGKPLVAQGRAPEQRVELPEPVPVYLTYLTAAPTDKGLVFRPDRYGRDGFRGDGQRRIADAR